MGFNYLWERKPLLVFGISSHLIFFSLLIVIQVMLPIYVNDYLHESAYVLASFKGMYAIGAISAGDSKPECAQITRASGLLAKIRLIASASACACGCAW